MSNVAFNLIGMEAMEQLFSDFADAGKGSYTVWVGTTVEYAAAVELGTDKQAPQPYMTPAVQAINQEEKMAGFVESFLESASGQDLQKGVEEVALELERRAKQLAPVDTGNLRASIQSGRTIEEMAQQSEANKIKDDS